jgi:DNA-directed RNA polymerase sigma subunit (sigma70/sigma32)
MTKVNIESRKRRRLLDADGMTTPEIASALGISRQAVDQMLLKAIAKLQREFLRRGVSPNHLV